MLIYKLKISTKANDIQYIKALKVGALAWLQDTSKDIRAINDEAPYLKYQLGEHSIHIDKNDINEYRAPTKNDIANLNLWLKEDNNLQSFKEFYHIIKDNDDADRFWVEGALVCDIAYLKNGQIELSTSAIEGNWDKEHNIIVYPEPLALPHLVISIDKCEEISE